MANQRLSKLQKKILTTLYSRGIEIDHGVVRAVVDEPKARKQAEDDGYRFTNEFLDPKTNKPRGELRYLKSIKTNKLRRSKLLLIINGWGKLNIYTDDCNYASVRSWQRPDEWNKRQVSLTRSLQTLCCSRHIDLLSRWEYPIEIYNKSFANKMGIKATNAIEERRRVYLDEYEKYKVLKQKDKTVAQCKSFGEYLDLEFQPRFKGESIGGFTTKRKVLNDYGSESDRNIVWVRLTEKGIGKAKELLNVK